MTEILYWVNYKSDLKLLTKYFKGCKGTGFYVSKSFFQNPKYSQSMKETFQVINKEILLNFNYGNDLRPNLRPDSKINPSNVTNEKKKISNEKRLKEKHKKIQKLKNYQDLGQCNDLVETYYNEYLKIKAFIEKIEKPLNPLEKLIFPKKKLQVRPFEFPYIPFPSLEKVNKRENKDEFNEIYEMILKITQNFFEIQKKNSKFQNSYFTIPLPLIDFQKNTELFSTYKDISKNFNNIILWIIDFNEIYNKKKQDIVLYFKTLREFLKSDNLIVKFNGIFSHNFTQNISSDFSSIMRLSGYPGRNINSVYAKRTKKLLDPKSFDFYNLNTIGERLKRDQIVDFGCSCEICSNLGIKTLNDARILYLSSDPENNEHYKQFLTPGMKTAKNKASKKQNDYILKHCFLNLDKIIHYNFKIFTEKYSILPIYKNWEKNIKEDAE